MSADYRIREQRMTTIKERYVTDENGKRIGVLLDLADYLKILEELEELASIKAYDEAKASGDEAVPFEQAVANAGLGSTGPEGNGVNRARQWAPEEIEALWAEYERVAEMWEGEFDSAADLRRIREED